MFDFGSVIIGTILLLILKFVCTIPLAKYLLRRRMPSSIPQTVGIEIPPPPPPPPPPEVLPQPQPMSEKELEKRKISIKEEKKREDIPSDVYILADVLVMSSAGFLIGLLSGYFFIGFALKSREWPGMIVFILSSFMGSMLSV